MRQVHTIKYALLVLSCLIFNCTQLKMAYDPPYANLGSPNFMPTEGCGVKNGTLIICTTFQQGFVTYGHKISSK